MLIVDNTKRSMHETFSYGVIYIYSIPDEKHKGRLKIGSATINSRDPKKDEIEASARSRIDRQTKTADVQYVLEHAELAITNDKNHFSDTEVHNVLISSGFPRKAENTKNNHSEWFEIDLATVKNAINATKEGRTALSFSENRSRNIIPFVFRPNQRDAIDLTSKAIKQKRKHFLWNAKMRFGKTAAAMQVAKENALSKVLIITHRPSVSVDWFDDFNKVFNGTDYEYSSKTKGISLKERLNESKPFVYFASIQDLRGSKSVVFDENSEPNFKGHDKNIELFDTAWDMLIVDEAHEGTQTSLGDKTISKIQSDFTLNLSGTPFNIIHKHEENAVYTWDYVMEQYEKFNWDENHPGVPNPYAELPSLKMFTYDIDTLSSHIGDLDSYIDVLDGAFKFHEFFRVKRDHEDKEIPEFVHEKMVVKYLDLLVNDKIRTKFPYATEKYRSYIKHSLWLLPNRIKVIKAMEKLLKAHPVFGKFGIVNISGNAKEDDESDRDAKTRVTNAIKNNEYTITLTGQRLTTGASIPQWTAALMLSDTNSATTYLQTVFRCQTPAKIDGKIKTHGYIFDFAPDRTLKLVAEAIELNHKSGKINTPGQRQAMARFLNFCPILAAKEGEMEPYDVGKMLTQLKKAIIDRVSRNGFDDPRLYNDALLKLDELDISEFNKLKAIIGKSTNEKINEIEINELGMTDLKTKEAEEIERKKKQKKELTDEEKEILRKLKEARDQKKEAVGILRAVSIRMPMMVYGAPISIKKGITLQKFIDLVDEESWAEFMPAGLSKKTFREFTKYYDEDIFREVTRNIQAKAFDCDDLLPTDRIRAITDIFKTFKNPDKETVLTPWNVVNRHITITFGGHDFRSGVSDRTGKPEWKSLGVDTSIWSCDDTKILEINSKSGLYPLLATYNRYSRQLIKHKKPEDKISKKLWKKVLENDIYILCKSPMAAAITRRTLAGYRGAKTNIIHIKDLVKKLQQKDNYKGYNINNELQEKFGFKNNDMKFTAVIGNPPYQITTDTNFAKPVYHLFFEAAKSLAPNYISLIHPARFLFNAGATPKEWNKKMLNDPHISIPLYEPSSKKIFSGVDIKGGVCITFWNKKQINGGLGGEFIADEEMRDVLAKTGPGGFNKVVGSRGETKLRISLDKKYPNDLRIAPNYFNRFPKVFCKKKRSSNEIKIIGLEKGNKRTERYIKRNIVDDPKLSKWKIFLSESNGSGAFGEVLSTPIIGEPSVGCSYTFVQIGSFNSRSEAQNCAKYLKTKFCRALLSTLKVTQHNTRRVWSNVPVQNFSEKSDIIWSKPISNIDKQLYSKYGLIKNEIDFIETRVKDME